MNRYPCVRCLFCHTGSEAAVARAIQRTGAAQALFAQRIRRLRTLSGWVQRQDPLLPGYLFVYSQPWVTCSQLSALGSVIRVLRYGAEGEGLLTGRDLDFAQLLWSQGGVIGVLGAVRRGDFVQITDGLLEQFHGRVVHLDKRNQIAKVELDLVGASHVLWLSFDCLAPGAPGCQGA